MQRLATKLVEVMKEVAYVEKKGNNDYHHYSYATSADVLMKINVALTKYKICSITRPEVLSIVDVTTAKGNVEYLATVKMDIMLIDSESGETITITGLGSGQDGGDKAVMKAQTAAIKYAYLLSMAISTGDDPEADGRTDENMVDVKNIEKTKKVNNNGSKTANLNTEQTYECQKCGGNITEKVYKYSMNKNNLSLCMKCQKLYNAKTA